MSSSGPSVTASVPTTGPVAKPHYPIELFTAQDYNYTENQVVAVSTLDSFLKAFEERWKAITPNQLPVPRDVADYSITKQVHIFGTLLPGLLLIQQDIRQLQRQTKARSSELAPLFQALLTALDKLDAFASNMTLQCTQAPEELKDPDPVPVAGTLQDHLAKAAGEKNDMATVNAMITSIVVPAGADVDKHQQATKAFLQAAIKYIKTYFVQGKEYLLDLTIPFDPQELVTFLTENPFTSFQTSVASIQYDTGTSSFAPITESEEWKSYTAAIEAFAEKEFHQQNDAVTSRTTPEQKDWVNDKAHLKWLEDVLRRIYLLRKPTWLRAAFDYFKTNLGIDFGERSNLWSSWILGPRSTKAPRGVELHAMAQTHLGDDTVARDVDAKRLSDDYHYDYWTKVLHTESMRDVNHYINSLFFENADKGTNRFELETSILETARPTTTDPLTFDALDQPRQIKELMRLLDEVYQALLANNELQLHPYLRWQLLYHCQKMKKLDWAERASRNREVHDLLQDMLQALQAPPSAPLVPPSTGVPSTGVAAAPSATSSLPSLANTLVDYDLAMRQYIFLYRLVPDLTLSLLELQQLGFTNLDVEGMIKGQIQVIKSLFQQLVDHCRTKGRMTDWFAHVAMVEDEMVAQQRHFTNLWGELNVLPSSTTVTGAVSVDPHAAPTRTALSQDQLLEPHAKDDQGIPEALTKEVTKAFQAITNQFPQELIKEIASRDQDLGQAPYVRGRTLLRLTTLLMQNTSTTSKPGFNVDAFFTPPTSSIPKRKRAQEQPFSSPKMQRTFARLMAKLNEPTLSTSLKYLTLMDKMLSLNECQSNPNLATLYQLLLLFVLLDLRLKTMTTRGAPVTNDADAAAYLFRSIDASVNKSGNTGTDCLDEYLDLVLTFVSMFVNDPDSVVGRRQMALAIGTVPDPSTLKDRDGTGTATSGATSGAAAPGPAPVAITIDNVRDWLIRLLNQMLAIYRPVPPGATALTIDATTPAQYNESVADVFEAVVM